MNTTTNWKKLELVSDVELTGVTVELDRVDGSIKGVIVRDANGKSLRCRESSFGMMAEVGAPPLKKTSWRVTGKAFGVDLQPTEFDNEREANKKAEEIGESAKVEKVEVDAEPL